MSVGPSNEEKTRIIQEFVPGKQVTLAHVIASPEPDLYVKLGLDPATRGALGILTLTPSESAIIAADVASKAANITLGFVDRFSGTLLITGTLADVERAIQEIMGLLNQMLKFSSCPITRS